MFLKSLCIYESKFRGGHQYMNILTSWPVLIMIIALMKCDEKNPENVCKFILHTGQII